MPTHDHSGAQRNRRKGLWPLGSRYSFEIILVYTKNTIALTGLGTHASLNQTVIAPGFGERWGVP